VKHPQVIELSKQNTDLEEEALALEQKLGEAEASVEKGEKRLAELSAQLASGANGSKEMREKVKEKEVRAHTDSCASSRIVVAYRARDGVNTSVTVGACSFKLFSR
jgi:chromosome segregation ATPase